MMKTAMQQLLDKLSECIKAGQDIEKLIPMLSNQYLPIERQQLDDAWSESRSECYVAHEAYDIMYIEQSTDFNHYFKTTYYE